MKKIIFCLLFAFPMLLNAQLEKTLKKTIQLKMPGKVYTSKNTGEDSLPGKRGASVVWHPLQKKYYAAFAGNEDFPFAVFDVAGKRLSDEDKRCMVDIRGLWYDPKRKKICGNGYANTGWFCFTLDAKGIPARTEEIAAGMIQPGEQSIGVFNDKSASVYFLYGPEIYVYNTEGMMEDDSTIRLYPGTSIKENIDDEEDYLSEDYNSNVLIFTGIPKAEFGLLNVNQKQVELYNRKTGLLTLKLKLPDDVKTYSAFNFSYSNGMYWAFDQETRTWTGFK